MPHLRPPISVYMPEEWDWADAPSSMWHPTRRLRQYIEAGLGLIHGDTYTPCVRDDAIYIERAIAPPCDRILISPGNPYRADKAWHAVDSGTYDGAEDSRIRSHIGAGASPRQAAFALLGIIIEHTGDPLSYYDDATCVALCAEIARRWP